MKNILFLVAILQLLHVETHAQSSRTLYLADSVAKEVLENEGLYTVMGGLKPISTVLQFQFEIDSVAQSYKADEEVRQRISELSHALSLLESSPIGFIILPFRQIHGNQRSFEVLVYHQEAVAEKITQYEAFFLERGLLPTSPVEQVLAQTEFDHAPARFRGYGYFFGYPAHAVDFFVASAQHEKDTKEFVKRDFYQIPVSSREQGAFVYAVPKDYKPQEVDLLLKENAMELLEIYKARKSRVMESDQQYPFLELYWDISKREKAFKNMKLFSTVE